MLNRTDIFRGVSLPPGAELIERGRALARDWQVVPGAFLDAAGVASEADFKRQAMASGRIMQHAQIGFRDLDKSCRAWRDIHDVCRQAGVTVDRYGICLDWAMGLPRGRRKDVDRGTGLVLDRPEDFVRLTAQAPVAPHFGDFVIGFPASVENTQAALVAGATSIGNLGQYFTFRLPYWDDEAATTSATVSALALAAAQPCEVLIHSNLDDGFAAQFNDLASTLGAVLLEKHAVETLIGGRVSHCWGHHYSSPVLRLAFHLALTQVSETPGTMIYGNTVSYRGGEGANYASLAGYLMADVVGQRMRPSGHAVNAIPVRENERIPDIEEVIEAQLFAGRMIEQADDLARLCDLGAAQELAQRIVAGGKAFFGAVMTGLEAAGIDTGDAAELLQSLKRIGGRQLEALFGAGEADETAPRGRRAIATAPVLSELEALAAAQLDLVPDAQRRTIGAAGLRVITASTDVHEHGKAALEIALKTLGVAVSDGGVSVDAVRIAERAIAERADAILLSTYNGIALSYFSRLKQELSAAGADVPVLIGGRLNQIPDSSNTSMPVDVSAQLCQAGGIVCHGIADAVPALLKIVEASS